MKLGLKLNEVQLSPHDPQWKTAYEAEKEKILKTLGDSIKVEHIGSTALFNIVAKPIIDILVGVKDLKAPTLLQEKLESMGYQHIPKQSFPDRLFFIKLEALQDIHHLHIIEHASLPWKRAISFRDYLLKHQDIAKEYEHIKKQLAQQYPHDRDTYSIEKQKYLRKVFEKINIG